MLRPRLYHDTAHTVARIRGKNGGVTSLCMLPRHTRSHSEFRTLLPPLHMQAVLGSESSGPAHCLIQEPCLAARGREAGRSPVSRRCGGMALFACPRCRILPPYCCLRDAGGLGCRCRGGLHACYKMCIKVPGVRRTLGLSRLGCRQSGKEKEKKKDVADSM